jgi:hypothetical protein
MRNLTVMVILTTTLGLAACGGSPNLTIVNQTQEKVDVQIKGAGDVTLNFNGIEPGSEESGNIGPGIMEVKAVFPKGIEATNGFRSEEGGEYKLIIQADPPGIRLVVE